MFAAIFLLILPLHADAQEQAAFVKTNFADLAITEIMYDPGDTGLFTSGDLEFVELYNRGETTLSLAGSFFTSSIEYTFLADASLQSGAYWVAASDASAFAERYGFAPDAVYAGQLNNGGERITLSLEDGSQVLSVRYEDDAPWPVTAAGHGFSLVLRDVNDVTADLDEAATWRFSGQAGGSPGAADVPSSVADAVVVVNEILPHTDPPLVDTVELYNAGSTSQPIGYWYLTDDHRVPRKFQIPVSLTLGAGRYWTFDEEELGFGFSSFGEEVFLFSADANGELTGYSHGFRFGTSANSVSFGRYLTSQDEEHFPALAMRTLGYENSEPLVGPVVLSEIMYHPSQGSDEYVELINMTDRVVPLYDPIYPDNTWRFSGIGNYQLPQGLILSPGFSLIVSPIEPALFRERYAVSPDIQITGPYTGTLNNAGERLKLLRADLQDADGTVPYFVVDEVRYGDSPPWPDAADGQGAALKRINLAAYGDDPVNWRASNEQRVYLPIATR